MNNVKKRIFFDLDGTMCEFKNVDSIDRLYEKGYFLNLKPHEEVLEAFKKLYSESLNNPECEYEVYILSAYLSDSTYAMGEKIAWIRKYIDPSFARAILVPYGKSKVDAVEYYTGIPADENSYLVDDYNKNLFQWEERIGKKGKGRALKLVNDINDRRQTWHGKRVYHEGGDCLEQILEAISD